ncbi:hypothetical protein PsorP6_014845 [Peronosclerospora sorghi]|uniref:Uncharacterized protein n=1 Tax=Peronosclerospora sorghi TaxID=230839 RepID=A0ACC0VSV7_9STRA|nr:hypothetical protein PsorP6_014845 [Peronosclerospora sorghi]
METADSVQFLLHWARKKRNGHRSGRNFHHSSHDKLFCEDLFIERGMAEEILKALKWSRGRCKLVDWMTMPYCAYVIANSYHRTVVTFALEGSSTVLPTKSAPNESSPIYLVLVNQNHFVKLDLLPGVPHPTICRYSLTYAKQAARAWHSIVTEAWTFEELDKVFKNTVDDQFLLVDDEESNEPSNVDKNAVEKCEDLLCIKDIVDK